MLSSGVCVVHAKLKVAGEEKLVMDSQFGRHVLTWCEEGIREQNDTARTEAPESAPGIKQVGTLWRREDELETTAPVTALAASLRQPWAGCYERRDDTWTGRTMQLALETRRDRSGILGWKISAKTSGLIGLAPAGAITGGGCQLVEVTNVRKVAAAHAHRKKPPPPEEKLHFDSRWGHHVLTMHDGGKYIVEENVSDDMSAKATHRWTRAEEEAPKAEPPKKGWVVPGLL